MKIQSTFLVVSISLLFSCSLSVAETLYVAHEPIKGKKTYQAIQEAINASEPSDEIIIQKGKYDETIRIEKPLSIKGESPGDVFIAGKKGAESQLLLLVIGVQGCAIENIVFDPNNISGASEYAPLISVRSSDVTLKKSIVRNSAYSGAWASEDKTNLKIQDCSFEKNNRAGVYYYKGAKGSVVNSTFSNNRETGLSACDPNVYVIAERCNFIENTKNGILVYNEACMDVKECTLSVSSNGISGNNAKTVNLWNNNITFNRKHGIHLYKVEQCTLKKNKSTKNTHNGIYIQECNRSMLEENQCLANKRNGFSFWGENLHIEMKKNLSKGNFWHGSYVGWGTQGIVEHNTFSINGLNGIISSDANVTIQENTCTENAYSGICVALGSANVLSRNTCKQNLCYGINVSDLYSICTLTDNVCEQNEVEQCHMVTASLGRARQMLYDGQYEKLQKAFDEFRISKRRYSDGGWVTHHFHDHLSSHYGWQTQDVRQKYEAQINKWITAHPESVAPHIVLANVYISYAWRYRGDGMADTVTEEGWKGFYKYLDKALAVLEEAENLEDQDPELYNSYLIVGKGLGKPVEWVEEKFKKGLQVEGDYYYLYMNMAEYLQPKWHGSEQELQAFAEKIYRQAQTKEDKSNYARIVQDGLYCNTFEDFKSLRFPYEKVKSSFEVLLELYPESYYYMNQLCVLACLYDDYQTAHRLFPIIESHLSMDAWKDDDAFVQRAKGWALSKRND